jgi:hypothetical protein
MPTYPGADLCIGPLNEAQGWSDFTCGVQALDHCLKPLAIADFRRRVKATFVLFRAEEPGRMLGFYTLFAMALSPDQVPKTARKHVPSIPVSAARCSGNSP